jgi:hypothetical protein
MVYIGILDRHDSKSVALPPEVKNSHCQVRNLLSSLRSTYLNWALDILLILIGNPDKSWKGYRFCNLESLQPIVVHFLLAPQ